MPARIPDSPFQDCFLADLQNRVGVCRDCDFLLMFWFIAVGVVGEALLFILVFQ